MDNKLVWYDNKESENRLYYLDKKDPDKKYEYYSENDNSEVENLVNLTFVNIPSIMNVLNMRYNEDLIYTFNGNILISINPFKSVDQYKIEDSIDIDNPHVYSLAESAYRKVYLKNQSILVSGESGSGKTENTKYILKYLCNKYAQNDLLSSKIILSNYIIELFGNAKTIRNDNSSRFGKFIKLYIKDNRIVGGDIENYLLEKLRVSCVNKLEKTYHIFYLVCTNDICKSKYGFKDITDYKILEQSNYLCSIDEFLDYNKLMDVFGKLEFPSKNVDQIFYNIKLILDLLNTQTKDALYDVLCENNDILNILEIDLNALYNMLTIQTIIVSGEKIDKNLDDDMIRVRIKSYCEDLYEDQFNKIIDRINLNLGDKTETYISILDIFGFEVFQKNSYEQLCINFTNEILQQIYNEYIFHNEQIEYEKENIDWTKIDFKNNNDIINLFTNKMSIFSIINEQSILGSGKDENIYESISKNLTGTLLTIPNLKRKNRIFNVKHFTGDVEYTIDNYIEKNRIKGKSAKIKTNLHYFSNQLNDLKATLDKNECYFIRCIKPNDENISNTFSQRKVYTQLLYSGIIEGIKIVLAGYPVKKRKDDFINEFRFFNYCNKDNILKFLENNHSDKKDFQIGKNKVFLKKEFYEQYLKKNNKSRDMIVIDLQKHVKRQYRYNHLQRSRINAVILQNNIRLCIAKRKFYNKLSNRAIVSISAIFKMAYNRNLYTEYHQSISRLLVFVSNIKIRDNYIEQKNKYYFSSKIALWFRRYIVKKRIEDRKNVKNLKSIVNEKEDIIKNRESIIDKQNRQIAHLMELLNNKSPDIDRTPKQINDNKEIIDDSIGSSSDYILVDKEEKQKNNSNMIKDSVIKEDYFRIDNYELTDEDNNTLKEQKLEDIGTKMHNLFLELNSREDDINMINHKYQVLLLAYERERKKNSTFSFIKRLFG